MTTRNDHPAVEALLQDTRLDKGLKTIGEKVMSAERLTQEDGLLLFEKGELSYLGALANAVRVRLHGDKTYFNRNFHIEPTNVCIFTCRFCSYSKLYKNREEGWELSIDQMLDIVKKYDGQPVTEVHIVGGVHPKMNLDFFVELLQKIRAHVLTCTLKASLPWNWITCSVKRS